MHWNNYNLFRSFLFAQKACLNALGLTIPGLSEWHCPAANSTLYWSFTELWLEPLTVREGFPACPLRSMVNWLRILSPPSTNRDIMSYKPVEAVVGTQPLSPGSPSVSSALLLASCVISDKIFNFSGPLFQVSWYSTPKHIINFQYYYKDGAKSFLLSPPHKKWNKIIEKMLPGWEKKLKYLGSNWKQVLFFILSRIKEVKPVSNLSQGEVVKRSRGKKRGYFGRNYWTNR